MKKLVVTFLLVILTLTVFCQAWMQYLPTTRDKTELTFFDYQAAFEQWCRAEGIDKTGYKYEKGEKVKMGGWKQFKRWEIEMDGRYDQMTGKFKDINIWKEYLKVKELNSASRYISGNWISLGYANSPGGYDGQGRLNCIAFHPDNANIFWVGAANGGLWKTTDHGTTWIPLTDELAQIGISSIIVPENFASTQTMYIGTGDRGHWADRGAGIFKSTDGGSTWNETDLTQLTLTDFYIGKQIIHPDITSILYAATNYGIYKTNDGWESSTQLLENFEGIDMEFHPTNPSIIYASDRTTRRGDTDTKIIRSTNGGLDWEDVIIFDNACRVEIAVSPDEPDRLYALVAKTNSMLKGIYRSDNLGDDMELIYDGSIPNQNLLGYDCDAGDQRGQGGYDLCLAVSKTDADYLFIGGINLWRSLDGGSNWNICSVWSGSCEGTVDEVHADQHWLEFQYNTSKIFALNDGGIYYSTDDGDNWNEISDGLVINQIYHLSNSQQDYDEIIMGLQDNSSKLWTDGTYYNWGDGDGTNCLINPVNKNIQYRCGYGGLPLFTTNHWNSSSSFTVTNDSTSSWFKAFCLDPNYPDTVYFGLTNLWRSENNGADFSLIHDPNDGSVFREIVVAPSNSDIIYALNDNYLYFSDDRGVTWTQLRDTLSFFPGQISDICVHNSNPSIIWAVEKWWGNGKLLYQSTDGGITWEEFGQGLPDIAFYEVIQNKLVTSYNELYLGTALGVFVKLGDQPWVPFSNGLPNTQVRDLDIYYDGADSKLRAGTYGRGFWESDLFSTETNMPGVWTGLHSDDWYDALNWQYMEVPNNDENVTIPAGCPNYPMIDLIAVSCSNITIGSGGLLTIAGQEINISGDVYIDGTLRMLGPGVEVNILGNITWGDDSQFSKINATGTFNVTGDWTFEEGATAYLDDITTAFHGIATSNLYIFSNEVSFGQLVSNKISPASVYYNGTSTSDLVVKNDLVVPSGSKFYQQSERNLVLWGKLDAQGTFYQQDGSFITKGSDTIHMAGSTSYFHNLRIGNSGTITLTSDISVRDTLDIMSGVLRVLTYNVELGGHLMKDAAGFLSLTTGKITFNGTQEQIILSDFVIKSVNILKPSDTLRILAGKNVEIEELDWTSGSVALEAGSVVSIEDLVDDGIWGVYRIKNSATLNITNPTGSVDLNGKLFISGGTVNVFGGNHGSYWPDAANAELHMSSGTLDFKDRGIFIRQHPTYTFTDNITGGTIRTFGGFAGDHTAFNPAGGIIELYGPDNAELSHGPGSSFYKVVINKGTTTTMQGINEDVELTDEPILGKTQKSYGPGDKPMQRKALPPSGTRANKVSVVTNLDIDDNLVIESGVLDINGYTVDVGQSLDISGTLNMLISSSLLNVNSNVTWRAGSFSNVTAGNITFKSIWTFLNGTNASFGGSNTVKAMGSSLTYIYHKDPDATFANLLIDKSGSALYLDDASAYPLRVAGNLSVTSGDNLQVRAADLIVNGIMSAQSGSTVGIQSGGSIDAANAVIDNAFNLVNGSSFESANMTVNGSFTLSDGGTVNADDLSLYGVFDVNAGSVLVHNSLYQAPASTLTIDGGSFIIDKAYTGNFMSFSGTTNLNGGFFEISYESIQFGTGAVVNILGGNLRVGGHFKAVAANSFKPDYGAVELINTLGATIECTNGNYFHELIINKNAGSNPCMLAYPTTINTGLTINSGELSTMNYTLNVAEDIIIQPNGKLTAGSSAINVGEDWVNNRGTNGFAEGTSSVWLVSSQPCQISSETFYNLDLDKDLAFAQYANMASGSAITILNNLTIGDGTLRMNDNCTLSIYGDLQLKSGGGLNANAAATGTAINIYGDWTDYNSVWSIMIGFASGQSTVYFRGSQTHALTANGGVNFYNLTLSKSDGSLIPYSNITVVNDFNLVSGEWRQAVSDLVFTFKDDFTIADPALWIDAVNTLQFKGSDGQTLSSPLPGWLYVGSLVAEREPSAGILNILTDINCSGKMRVSSGEVDMGNHNLTCEDSLAVFTDGYLTFTDGAYIRIGSSGSLYISGGHLNIWGDPSVMAMVTRSGSGYYEILVENGGVIDAVNTEFEYMNGRGLNVDGTGMIGGSQPFLNCSFSRGEASGTLLLINNSQDVTLYNVNFPANTWSGTDNVSKTESAGNVYMANATGDFAGPGFENDPFYRIHWPAAGIWEGDVSTEFHNAQNWRYNFQVPDASTDVVIPSGKPNYPVFSLIETTVNSLLMEPSTSLTISKDSLIVTTWADIRGTLNLTGTTSSLLADSLVWQPGSACSMSATSYIYLTDDMFIKNGSDLNISNGTIRFYGSGESNLVCHDTAQIFSLQNFKNSNTWLNLAGDTLARLTVNGTFRNGSGSTLKCPSSQEWVFDGNFRNTDNGHFRCQSGTIRLSGPITSTYFRVEQGDYFNNIIIDTLVNLYTTTGYSDTLRVNGDLTFAAGTGGSTTRLTANAFRIMLRGDWINNAGTAAFVTGAGQTHQVHFWDPAEKQEVRGNSNFMGVYVNNESEEGVHIYDVVNMNSFIPSTPVWFYGTNNIMSANFDDNLTEVHLDDGAIMQITSLNQGGLVHVHDGSLTVNDLNQNYVTGSYTIDGGTLILKQAEYTTTHDLFYANLTINGGEMFFIGGSGQSKWPSLSTSTSNITMTGGLFYLQNHSVEVMPGNFSENISGGTIRLPGNFIADAGVTSFHPTGGIVELYDDWDVDCGFLEPQCWFHDLYVNKSGEATVVPFYGIRAKNELKLVQGNMQLYGNPVIVGPN